MLNLECISDCDLPRLARHYDKIVIWGRNIWHTHYWITSAYFNALTDLGIPCLWVDDSEASASLVPDNSFVIFNSYDVDHIQKVSPKAFLAFRRNQFSKEVLYHLNKHMGVYQHQQHLDYPMGFDLGCKGQVYYYPEERLLQQPWGTDLASNNFQEPSFSPSNRVYWTGSIWSQSSNISTPEWGNTSEINLMNQALANNSIRLVQLQDAYRDINIGFIRHSRIAPAIQGYGQVKAKHLACRFFKNISYGQFCVSNNASAKELLGSSCIYSDNIEELIEQALAIGPDEAKEMCSASQRIIKSFTIAAGLARALALIEYLS